MTHKMDNDLSEPNLYILINKLENYQVLTSDVIRMQSINIFIWFNKIQYFICIDVLG